MTSFSTRNDVIQFWWGSICDDPIRHLRWRHSTPEMTSYDYRKEVLMMMSFSSRDDVIRFWLGCSLMFGSERSRWRFWMKSWLTYEIIRFLAKMWFNVWKWKKQLEVLDDVIQLTYDIIRFSIKSNMVTWLKAMQLNLRWPTKVWQSSVEERLW